MQSRSIEHSTSSKFFNSSAQFKSYVSEVLLQDSDDWNWGKSHIVNKMKQLSENHIFNESIWLYTRDDLLEFNIQYLRKALDSMKPKRYNRIISYLMFLCIDGKSGKISLRASQLVLEYCQKNKLMEQLFLSFVGRTMGVGASYETATYSVLDETWKVLFPNLDELFKSVTDSDFTFKGEFIEFFKFWYESMERDDSIQYNFSTNFMKKLDDGWSLFNEMPKHEFMP